LENISVRSRHSVV